MKWAIEIKGKQIELTLAELRKLNDATLKILCEHDHNLPRLIRLVCQKRKLTEQELFAKCRRERNAIARWCLWTLLSRQHNKNSFQIAAITGATDTNVRYGLMALQNRMESDPNLRKELAWLENGKTKVTQQSLNLAS